MKMRIEAGAVAVILLVVSVFFVTPAYAGAGASDPETEVLEVERNWLKAFNTLDFDLMASLYHHSPETVSFSPNSATRFQGWDVIADGFKKYFSSPPGTYAWTMDDERVTMLSGDVAIIHGIHVVVDRPADGQEMTGKHLFTRIVQKIDGGWRIVHEHESHIPRAMPPQQQP
jgi:uncharacterized protein (TIGR02246 family)